MGRKKVVAHAVFLVALAAGCKLPLGDWLGWDTTPPTVQATVPAGGALGVSPHQQISVAFSESMDRGSAAAAFSLLAGSSAVAGSVVWSGNTLAFQPADCLEKTTTFALKVAASAKDDAGNALGRDFVSSFTTAEANPAAPTVTANVPANLATDVACDSQIAVTFSECMNRASAEAAFSLSDGASSVAGTFSWLADTMVFRPSAFLAELTEYSVKVATSAKDRSGTSLSAEFNSSFTTQAMGQVAEPTFFPEAGTYTGAQTVTISTTTRGAFIRYTTDGSAPTGTVGTLYSGPVTVETSETIKAIAYEPGWVDSAVAAAVYTINHPWETVGTAGFSAADAWCTSLVIDSSGTPYVAYGDGANGGKATVMKYSGGSWQTVGTAGFSAGEVEYTSLAIGPSGTPHIAYKDYGNGGRATVMKYSGGSWQTVGTAGFSAGEVDRVSLAIDSTNAPCVGYRDFNAVGKATVKKYAGGSWQTLGTTGFSAGEALCLSVAIDSTGAPYVAYWDYFGYMDPRSKAIVMKYAGGLWQTVGTAGFTDAWPNSLAIDSSDIPFVACKEDANGDYKATVMSFAGGSWQVVGTAGFSAGNLEHLSLAIDPSGAPYVAYEDAANSLKATVMKYAGGLWRAVGTAGFSAGAALYTSLALDSIGTPYVAYIDEANSYRATVMRFR